MRVTLMISAAGLALAAGCNSSNGSTTSQAPSTGGASSASGAASGSTGAAAASTGSASGGSGSSTSSGGTGGVPDSGPPTDPASFYSCGCLWPDPFCGPGGPGTGCLACLADSDCPASAPHCSNGACQGCRNDGDCSSGQVCNGFSSTCMPDCRLDGGTVCNQGTTCEPDAGICFSGCAGDTDCDGLTLPFCVKGFCNECRTPSDCPLANAGCLNGACGRCQTDTDCGQGLSCLGTGFNTFCGCLTNAQCGPYGQVCVGAGTDAGSCGCTSAADCDLGQICDLVDFAFPGVPAGLGQCVIPCQEDGGFNCLSAAWQVTGAPFCNPATGACSTCITNADCLSPTTTQGGPDHPFCAGVGQSLSSLSVGGGGVCGCTASDQCPTGTVCDTLNGPRGIGIGACVGACDVASGINCAALGSSSDVFCSASTGVCSPCQTDAQCQSLYGSVEPACLSPGPVVGPEPTCGCQSSDQCNPGEICDLASVATGQCLRPCDVDGGTDCQFLPSAQMCNDTTALCSACLSDSDCKANRFSVRVNPFCEVDAGYCTQCRSLADCTPSQPGCVPQLGCGFCQSDADCAAEPNLHCDPTTNICRYACQSSFSDGSAGQCPEAQPFCDTATSECWECRTAADCAGKGTANTILCFSSTHQCNGEGPDAGGAG